MTTKYFFKDHSDDKHYTGTKREIVMQYIEAKCEITYTEEEEDGEGYLAEVIGESGYVCVDEFADANDGSDTAALESLYDQMVDFLNDYGGDFYELSKAECFIMDYDKLLDMITAREARDNDLDLDDEQAVREWYYQEKVA